MSFSFDNFLLVGSILLLVSIVASKSNRFGVPALLLFLIVGILAGSEGIGGIYFEDAQLAKFIGLVALILILFSGGLDTRLSDIRPVFKRGIILSTIGVTGTALLTGFFVHLITPLGYLESFLLGSIISSTDAASVFTILRSKRSGLKGRIRPLLEFESGSNDPMAYFLTIFFLFLIQQEALSWSSILVLFVKQFVLGGAVGIGMGYVMWKLVNRINLDFEGLYAVLMLALALFVFSFTSLIGGNGFLAVYLSAIFMGNQTFVHKRSLIKHFDGQAWLMQIIMFLSLGLLVYPSKLFPLIGLGMAVFFFLLLVARPLVIFVLLSYSGFSTKAKLFISWVGLRGAVPIILAIYALDAKTPNSELIFNLVFFISAMSVLIQGTTIPYFANKLKLSMPAELRKKSTVDIELANKVKSIHLEIELKHESFCNGKSLVDIEIPPGVGLSLIERNGQFWIPDGRTTFLEGDKLTVIADSVDSLQRFSSFIGQYK